MRKAKSETEIESGSNKEEQHEVGCSLMTKEKHMGDYILFVNGKAC
jgi:hypothetical protein